MAAISWNSAASGTWTTGADWSTGTPPGASDSATIGVAGSYTVSLTTAVTVDAITISDPTASFVIDAPGRTETVTANLTNGGLTTVEATALAVGGAISNSGSLALTGTATLSGGAFSNTGVFGVAADFGDGGGGAALGALTNRGQIDIGNAGSSAAVTVKVSALTNNVTGTINLNGGAVLDDTGAAPATLAGVVDLAGSARLEYASGAITAIAANSQLSLDGAGARIVRGSATGSNSALTKLATNNGELDLAAGAALAVSAAFTNNGAVYVDSAAGNDGLDGLGGGSTLSIAGTLTNNGGLYIGNASSVMPTTVSAGALVNDGGIVLDSSRVATILTVASLVSDGEIEITGGAARATLDVLGAAPATLAGTYRLTGNAILEFASGAVTTIGAGSDLALDGPGAHVALSSDTASNGALSGLTGNDGTLELQDGAAVSTGKGFANSDILNVDAAGDGGSTLAIGGTLTNRGTLVIGNDGIAAATAVTAKALVDSGTIDLTGAAAAQASLTIAGAAPATLNHSLSLTGDALLAFGSGAITAIGADGVLSLDGAGSRVSSGTGTGSNSALTKLSSIVAGGILNLENGASVTTTTALSAAGDVFVDDQGSGGSTLAIGGTLAEAGEIEIGNTVIATPATVSATGFSAAYLALTGSAAVQASLDIAAAAPAILTGDFALEGDALLSYKSGAITAIGANSTLALDGSKSRVSSGSATGTNSALTKLGRITGMLQLEDGAVLTTTTDLNVTGTLNVDADASTGGSRLTVGGTLSIIGAGNLEIGADDIATATTVKVAALANLESIAIYGAAAVQASLEIAAPAPTILSGDYFLSGDALLSYGSGLITEISGNLELDGRRARIATGTATGTNSALTSLDLITGELALEDGATVTTSSYLLDEGSLYIDNAGPGGSTLTVGGELANYLPFSIGNAGITAATTVTAASLDIDNIDLTGGAAAQASLNLAEAAPTTLPDGGNFSLSGDALLSFASGAITTIDGTAGITLDGAHARIAVGGATSDNSALVTLTDNAGQLTLRDGAAVTTADLSNSGTVDLDDGSVLTTGDLTNTGTIDIDSDADSDVGGSKVTVNGTLTVPEGGSLSIGNASIVAGTLVTATGLSIAAGADLAIAGGTATLARLNSLGAAPAPLTGDVALSGDALLSYASGAITELDGFLELSGRSARVSSGSATGTNSALTTLATIDSGSALDLTNGAVVDTTTALTINFELEVDGIRFPGLGGSRLSVGGVVTNEYYFDIGNAMMAATTIATVAGLENDGMMYIEGSGKAIGELVVNSDVTNTGYISIYSSGELKITGGGNTYTQSGTDYTSVNGGKLIAPTIDIDGGGVEYYFGVTASETTAFNLGAGFLWFAAGVQSGITVTFTASTGTLYLVSAPEKFAATIAGFGSSDAIDLYEATITGLSYSGTSTSGVLTVTGSDSTVTNGTLATLHFTGDYTTASFSFQSDGGTGYEILDPPAAAQEIAGASSQNVTFAAGRLTSLTLADAPGYKGRISGFAPADTIDLADIAFGAHTTLGYRETNTGGVLTVGDGSKKARLALLGQYMAASFALSSDGHGGTLVGEPATAAQNHLAAAIG